MVNNIRFNGNNTQTQTQYAHIVKENPFQKVASTVKTHSQNVNNLYKAIAKAEGTDYTLGRMNDTTIRMGSLGIATLASSKALSSVSGIGEFIGFACWFASMGISPKIINKMVQAKYGLNLDKEYVDSYGRRKKLFEDPGFICWDLIPNAELDRIGDRMGVPKGIINRREAIQEKISQVNVQAKTWMMLAAGISTPVIASVVADSLKKPFNGLLNSIHSRNIAGIEAKIESAMASGNVDKARKLLASAVDSTFGKKEASAIARMWQEAPDQIVKKTGIIDGAVAKLGDFFKSAKKVLTGKEAWIPKISTSATIATDVQKAGAIAQHLTANVDAAKQGIQLIDNNIGTARSWADKLIGIMQKHPELKDQALEEFIGVRAQNLASGFGNLKTALEAATQNGASPDLVKKLIIGVTDAQAGRMAEEELAKFVGSGIAKEVKELLKAGKTEKAIDLLSKRPVKLVDDAVKNNLLHQRWLKRIGLIGVGLIAATALYVFFFMGRDNKYNPKINADGTISGKK